MKRLLLITTLDVGARRNNREHHLIARLGAFYDETWVVHRRLGRPEAPLRDLLRPSVDVVRDGAVTRIAVNPGFNPPEGALRARSGVEADGVARRGAARAAAGRLADMAAIGKDLRTISALATAARRHAPMQGARCQALGPWAAAAAARLRREGRLPAYAYVDRDYEPGFVVSAVRRRWAARMEARAAREADLVLSIGSRLAALRRRQSRRRIELSPTGVDVDRFRPRARTAPGRPVTLIFTGRLAPWSGVEEAVGALALLAARGRGARLRALGPADPGYARRLSEEARRLGVGDRVEILGERPHAEVAAALAEADIGLAVFRPTPLRVHACPLKLLEYMACGLPVVALADSESGDIVQAAGCGETCAATAGALADAVVRMTGDPARFARMSAAGPAAAARHDWGRVMAREHALMEAMLAAAPSAGRGRRPATGAEEAPA